MAGLKGEKSIWGGFRAISSAS